MRYVVLPCLLFPSITLAQDPAAVPVVPGKADPVAHGEFGLDFTTAYFFRGIQKENQGIIAQPRFELGYDLYEGTGTLKKLDLTFGLWNSLHDGPTGTTGGRAMWYESDFYIDLTAKVDERWSVGTIYTSYYSPNGSFVNYQELAFRVGYDDRGQFDVFDSGLQPHVLLALETKGQADNPTNNGGARGAYLELGVEPTFAVGNLGQLAVTLALPATLGLGLSDYYEPPTGGSNDFFGYLDLGAVASAPLTFLSPRMGPWQAHAGLHLLFLGDNNEQRNQGDAAQFIFSFGMSTTF